MLKKALLFGLFLTATWEGIWYLTVSGINVRPYEFFLVLLLFLLLLKRQIKLDVITLLLLLYVMSGVPGLLNSLSVKDTLVILFFESVMVLVTLAVRYSTRALDQLESAVQVWALVVANGVNAFGLLQFVTWVFGMPISPMWKYSRIYRPYSVFIEPNYYGSFLASQLVILTILCLSPSYKKIHRLCLFSIPPALLLLGLNQSRGPWLGFLFALSIFVTLRYLLRGKLPSRLVIGTAIAVSSAVVLFAAAYFLVPKWGTAIQLRIQDTVDPLTEETAIDRLEDMKLSLDYSNLHPFIGSGLGTWGMYVGRVGREIRTAPRNIFLAWLFEKGFLGLFAGLMFFCGLIFHVMRALQVKDERLQTLTWAMFAAWLAVFTTFHFTFLELSPFYWVLIGMLLSATDASLKERASME